MVETRGRNKRKLGLAVSTAVDSRPLKGGRTAWEGGGSARGGWVWCISPAQGVCMEREHLPSVPA